MTESERAAVVNGEWSGEGLATQLAPISSLGSFEVCQTAKRDHEEDVFEASSTCTSAPWCSNSPRSLKRQRDEVDVANPVSTYESPYAALAPSVIQPTPNNLSNALNFNGMQRESSPAQSTISSLTDPGTATPSAMPNSPTSAFAFLTGVVPPPPKRVKLTFAEKEERRIMKEIRDREKAEERARREVERREKEQDKARRDAEKEAERRQKESEREAKRLMKEVEDAEKDQKKKIKEDEKRKKDDEKRKKDEERQRLDDEKRQKERSQLRLNAFFKAPAQSNDKPNSRELGSSSASNCSVDVTKEKSPKKEPGQSEYEKTFLPFFLQTNVKLAPVTRFERDEQACESLRATIDSYICGDRSPGRLRELDPSKLFKFPDFRRQRGKRYTPVREIMSESFGGAAQPVDLTTESQNTQIRTTRKRLSSIPYKVLNFSEDVRPPYTGTFTKQPESGGRLARNFRRRDLPNVDYDYDSEADWEPPGEDDEEILSEGEDEEDGDADEDLEGFLDDAEDTLLNARKVIQVDLEPKSTGLCWEDHKRRIPNPRMCGYAMEIIHENPNVRHPIDPFATHYWESPAAPVKAMEPPRAPLAAMKVTSAGVNGLAPPAIKMFGTPDIKPSLPSVTSNSSKVAKKLIDAVQMPDFKLAVHNNHSLSKLGLIEVLNKQFGKLSKAAIKGTLETYFQRQGAKEADKRWVFIESGPG